MSARWEYLVLSWAMTATPPDAMSDEWRLEASFHIFRPGALSAETRTYDGTQPSTLGFELLNELGADGWELVSNVAERKLRARDPDPPALARFPSSQRPPPPKAASTDGR